MEELTLIVVMLLIWLAVSGRLIKLIDLLKQK